MAGSGEINLIDILRAATKNEDELFSKTCEVTSVDTEAETCECQPIDESAGLLDVKLASGLTTSNNLYIPVVGSFVVVTFISNSSSFVSMFSELESVNIKGDQFGGLIKIEELKAQLEIVTARIDTLYDALKNGTTVPEDGGSTYKATVSAALAAQAETEDFSEIENDKVKHG